MTVSSLEYPSVPNTLKDNKFASGATPTNLEMVSAKRNGATACRNSLITLSSHNPSYMRPVTIVVHRVVVRIGRRVWPISIPNKVITTKDFEARADTSAQLSHIKSVNSQNRQLKGSYSRVGVLDTAVDDRNSGPSSQDTILMQLLDTSDAMHRVIRRSGIITERLALDRVQDPDARRLIDRGHSSIIAGAVERRPERVLGAGMVALDAHAGEQVRVEPLDDPEPGRARDLVEETGALGPGLELHDVPPRHGVAVRRGGLVEVAARGEVDGRPGAARRGEQGQEGSCRAHLHGLGGGSLVGLELRGMLLGREIILGGAEGTDI